MSFFDFTKYKERNKKGNSEEIINRMKKIEDNIKKEKEEINKMALQINKNGEISLKGDLSNITPQQLKENEVPDVQNEDINENKLVEELEQQNKQIPSFKSYLQQPQQPTQEQIMQAQMEMMKRQQIEQQLQQQQNINIPFKIYIGFSVVREIPQQFIEKFIVDIKNAIDNKVSFDFGDGNIINGKDIIKVEPFE